MKKNICTFLLTVNAVVFMFLALTFSIWAVVAAVTMIGFAALEDHCDGNDVWHTEETS